LAYHQGNWAYHRADGGTQFNNGGMVIRSEIKLPDPDLVCLILLNILLKELDGITLLIICVLRTKTKLKIFLLGAFGIISW
jgi:hypothetical protein